jgi:hypothetical protein
MPSVSFFMVAFASPALSVFIPIKTLPFHVRREGENGQRRWGPLSFSEAYASHDGLQTSIVLASSAVVGDSVCRGSEWNYGIPRWGESLEWMRG